MKKHKICIIGDGLAGLTTAIVLKELNLNIDLFGGKKNKDFKKDERTTAISESNYQFLRKQILQKNMNYFWPCKKINLFYENKNKYLNFMNFENRDKNLMYIFENNKFNKSLISQIKKSKNIRFFKKSIKEINQHHSYVKFDKKKKHYDLIILCTGSSNNFYKNITGVRSIKKNYQEYGITATLRHNLKVNAANQYFFKEGPFAILPYKKNKFSLVWSIPKDLLKKNIKSLITKKLNNIFGKQSNFKISRLQSFPLYLDLKTKYFENNILILGQGIHLIHPMAGQGFNLILRDIKKLFFLIEKNLNLGLAIKDSYILKEFNNSRNPENTIIGLGNDLMHIFFKENKLVDPIKSILLKNIGKYESIKKISKSISDKGFYL